MSTVALNESNFEETITKEGIVVVDWWAPWCGPCRAFAPTFEKTSESHPDIVFGKVNTEENQGLGGAFQIRSIPTLMIFRDGIMLFNQAGMVPAKALEDVIAQVKGADMVEVRAQMKAEKEKQAASA